MAGADAYAGLMQARKDTSFRNKWPFAPSVRERVIARIEQRARNVDVLFREVAKPGIAPGSGPGDRGFESRLPDHSQMPFGRSGSQVEHGSKELPRAWRPREIHRNRPVVGFDC
jgi:hypothetical protein